jgi:hypothetical protein
MNRGSAGPPAATSGGADVAGFHNGPGGPQTELIGAVLKPRGAWPLGCRPNPAVCDGYANRPWSGLAQVRLEVDSRQ